MESIYTNSYVGTVEVKKLLEETEIKWTIPNFFSFFVDENEYYVSPDFYFRSVSWHLKLYRDYDYHDAIVMLHLCNDIIREYSVEYYFGLKKHDGSVEQLMKGILKGDQKINQLYQAGFIGEPELRRRKSELVPYGDLIICGRLKFDTSIQPSLVLGLPKLKKLTRKDSLFRDYKKLFLEGQNHDLILKVGDKQFPVHRGVLMARSPVFESMLSHDMKERNSGVIDVSDCEPTAMKDFLLYVYCGKVEKLDETNMFALYYAADKYDVATLKKECSDFMKKALSPSNACEVIQLAVNHADSVLEEYATEYFCNNSHIILRTLAWQSFLKDNSTLANELLLKSIDGLRNANNFLLAELSF